MVNSNTITTDNIITDYNDWDLSKEELMLHIKNSLDKYFVNTNYHLTINKIDGDGKKLIDIFKSGESGRCGFISVNSKNKLFTVTVKTEYLTSIKMKVKDLPNTTEIKQGRYPGWKVFKEIPYSKVCEIMSVITHK